MKNYHVTLLLTILSIMGLNAQEKHVFSEKAKAAFKKIATPESTLKWMTIKETEKVSKDEFLQKSKAIFDLNAKSNFKEIRVNEGANGWKHHRLQQTFDEIPIFGAEYLLHEKNGLVETANGQIVAGLKLSTTPSITEEVALQMLLNEIGAEKYAWEDAFSEKIIKDQKEDKNATYYPKGELIIAPNIEDFNSEDFTLAYKFRIKTLQPFSHVDYIIDAFTGNLIYENNLLCQNDVQGTCQTHHYGTVPITMDYDGTDYRLKESGRNIETYNGNGHKSENVTVLHFANPTPNWTTHKSGCEAHWVVENTYDYFLNAHYWQGHDDYGSRVITWANVGNNWNNAQGGGGEIYLGEGDGINYSPFTAIDIVAHEFTHSIIQATANLQYNRESGALSESFADIFGTMVEFEAEPNPSKKDWLLGEDISMIGDAGAQRDMSNPSLKGHPNTYKDDNWKDITSNCGYTNDFCGVHTNSGVQNHWFYILANGKTGTNYFGYDYNVAGIGKDKAAKLALENLKNYLSPFSGYKAARNGSLQAATALNFTMAEINQIKEAWCAVGVGDCDNNITGEITVTSPNGGEALNQGIAKNITWTKTGNTGTEVKIEYSINAGNEWHIVTEATTNNGTYQWFPPGVATNLALIRISSNANETIYDVSNDYFSINSCTVKASFETSDHYPCANETVTFTSTSTGGANTYKWYINGILYHTGHTFIYNFSQGGQYRVELRATIGNICGDVENFTIFVKPTINTDFTYNTVAQTTNFIAPYNNLDASYVWTTGDGSTYQSPNIGKIYESAGEYTVCLRVVISGCGWDSRCKSVQVNVSGCTDPAACNYNSGANISDNTCIYGNCNNCLASDSLALIALYNSTDGANWTNTWDLSQPVNTWYGITTLGCNVTFIDLDENNLTGFIPSQLGNLQKLEWLKLDGNSITGSIPLELGNLQNLERLWLHSNSLIGSIPVELGSLQNLQRLYLSANNLTGSIPIELTNLQNLQYLSLGGNNLTGYILTELENLQNLQYLYLGSNNLTGSIPVELGNLQNLKHLYLFSNDLTGSIPSELGNLEKLEWLRLNNSNLTGSIPSELGNLQNLQLLYLFDNSLTGSIPVELGNLQNLENFRLFNNNLTGSIPSEFGNLQNVVYLYLYDNSLTGSIPVELGNLQNLKYLYLYDNSLTGSIPSDLGNSQNLEYLYLYDNSLTGSIPVELGNLQNLKRLYLYNNSLAGSISSELGNLQNLKHLYLYNNNLSGCYPNSICNLNLAAHHFDCTGNLGLPDNGSDQGFFDFCDGITPCISTEVYPGDMNFDGITNHKDILSFGLYNGEYGVERDKAYQDINWSGHPSSDWGVRQENDSEIKHIDADGNGVVDLRDVESIQTNYGDTHTASPITNTLGNSANGIVEVSLQANAMPSFIGNDDQLILDILIDDLLGSELSLYGGYFSVEYDDPDLVISDIEVVFNPSWFGTPNEDFEYIVYNDEANKKIDIGITKVDHQNSIGEGVIGQLKATVNNETPWDTITLNFIVDDIGMQNAESFALAAGANSALSSFQVTQPACVPSLDITANTPLDFNHIAQGLIQTNGNIIVNENQPVTFRSDRLKVNDSFSVEEGAKFEYYNDPCGITNRGVNTNVNTCAKFENPKNLISYNYQIDEESLIYNFELSESDEITIEIVNKNGETTEHDFGIKHSGQNQIIIPVEKLPKGEFMVCLKIGFNRYYTQSVRK